MATTNLKIVDLLGVVMRFEYFLVSDWGSPSHSATLGLTVEGKPALRDGETIVLESPWRSARVFRGNVDSPELEVPLSGRMAVTDQRVIWWTPRLELETKASRGAGDAVTLVTGSLLAGFAMDALSKRRAQGSAASSPQSIVGAIDHHWLEWIGAFPDGNYVRIGVKEGNFNAMTNISIDLVLPEETAARSVAETILEKAKVRRISAGVGEERHRVEMAQTKLPADKAGVKLIGWNFAGSTKPWGTESDEQAFMCSTIDVAPGALDHPVRTFSLDLNRENVLKQLLIRPRRPDDMQSATFVVTQSLVSKARGHAAGGGVLAISKARIIGLVLRGQGPDGPVDSERGNVALFTIDHALAHQATAQRNWRGKITSIDFTSPGDDGFALSITEVVGAIKSGGASGTPSSFDQFIELYLSLSGRRIG